MWPSCFSWLNFRLVKENNDAPVLRQLVKWEEYAQNYRQIELFSEQTRRGNSLINLHLIKWNRLREKKTKTKWKFTVYHFGSCMVNVGWRMKN